MKSICIKDIMTTQCIGYYRWCALKVITYSLNDKVQKLTRKQMENYIYTGCDG